MIHDLLDLIPTRRRAGVLCNLGERTALISEQISALGGIVVGVNLLPPSYFSHIVVCSEARASWQFLPRPSLLFQFSLRNTCLPQKSSFLSVISTTLCSFVHTRKKISSLISFFFFSFFFFFLLFLSHSLTHSLTPSSCTCCCVQTPLLTPHPALLAGAVTGVWVMHPAWVTLCAEAKAWVSEAGVGMRVAPGCHPLCGKQLCITREFRAESVARAQLADYICQLASAHCTANLNAPADVYLLTDVERQRYAVGTLSLGTDSNSFAQSRAQPQTRNFFAFNWCEFVNFVISPLKTAGSY